MHRCQIIKGLKCSVFWIHRLPASKISLAMTMSSLHVDQRNSAMPRTTSPWMITVSVSQLYFHIIVYNKYCLCRYLYIY